MIVENRLTINLYFSDIVDDALANTLANIYELSAFLDQPQYRKYVSFKSYKIYKGSMFNCFDK